MGAARPEGVSVPNVSHQYGRFYFSDRKLKVQGNFQAGSEAHVSQDIWKGPRSKWVTVFLANDTETPKRKNFSKLKSWGYVRLSAIHVPLDGDV